MEKDNKMSALIVLLSIIFISLLSGVGALTVAYRNSETNSVIIYYQGYDTPFIEYRLEKGNWYPKLALEKNNEIKDFTHKIVIPVEDGKAIVAKFSDGKGNCLDNSGRNYEFEKGIWLFFENGAMVRLEDLKKFNIVKFDVQPNATSVSTGMEVTLSVSTLGGTGPYTYRFVAKDASGAETVIQDFNANSLAKWKPETAGNYMLIATAKDSTGVEVTQNIEGFKVLSLAINGISSSLSSPQKVGTTIPLSMDIDNTANLELKCYYEISSDGTDKEKIEATTDGTADWTPQKAGKYKITGYIENENTKINKTVEFEIEEEEQGNNSVVIYYHSNKPHDIFYGKSREGGSYSDIEMIGDSMSQDNSIPGYEYKFATNIADDEVLVVYFINNQNGDTDDNDGRCYVVRPGVYGIKNNQVYNLADYMNNSNSGNNENNNNNTYDNDDDDDDNGTQWNWNSFYNTDDD